MRKHDMITVGLQVGLLTESTERNVSIIVNSASLLFMLPWNEW